MAQVEITVCDHCDDHIDWESGQEICGPIDKDYCGNLCFENDSNGANKTYLTEYIFVGEEMMRLISPNVRSETDGS